MARHLALANITLAAILNDTTGCLVAAAYKWPDTAVGVIIGTGTNASYVEVSGQGGSLASPAVPINTTGGWKR